MILVTLNDKNILLEHVAPTGEVLDTAEIPVQYGSKKDGSAICMMSNLQLDNAMTDMIATLQAWSMDRHRSCNNCHLSGCVSRRNGVVCNLWRRA